MAVWSAVSVSTLEYSRIDADFYHPTYLNELDSWRRLDERVGVARLAKIIAAPVRTGRTPASRLIKGDEKCIRFIKTDTVREGSIDFDNSALLPVRVVGERDIIPEDAVVMTIIGATPEIVGRAAIVRPDDPECVTNQNVAVIRTKGVFDPYFLTAYFQTKWGRDQVWRHSRRTEQVNLNCREVERILVPNPDIACQEDVGNLVRESFACADRSVELHQKAQQRLEAALGMDRWKLSKPVGYTSRFSEVETSRRFDPEHFSPAFHSYKSRLPAGIALSPLSHHLQFCRRGKQPNYAESGLPVVNSKHVESNRVVLESNRKALPNLDSNLQIRSGDILINGTGRGTIGRAAPYLYRDSAIPDNHVTILRSESLDPVFASLYLNSFAGRMQVEMHQRGSSGQLELYPFDIRKFLIWCAPVEFQRELRQIYEKAVSREREASRLLAEAKARVEQLIEEAVKS
ncbi:type I restriction enzyme M protein [Paraburkholderia terricola]|uniref:hypothetical protein n=1 Tax=Paraburkholderia terricola TaxID=169427 RepID=UPI002858615B|nr:hypothetical protein [Paraburkholderia terricola]MDR6448359.1 type I restriction enzyme M protein [Paraburkholderia terricola]